MIHSERHRQNQAAFAAIYTRLADLADTRTLWCETRQEHATLKQQFEQLHICYDEVACLRSSDARRLPGFRVSTATFIFLATLQIVQSN
jgi:hypothetical protein